MYTHLTPALVALSLFAALVAGYDRYAQSVGDRCAPALVPTNFHEMALSGAMERACVRQKDVLPLFGTSQVDTGGACNPTVFFNAHSTGFQVCRIGWKSEPFIAIAEQVAALGDAAAGKRIVISVVPELFFWDGEAEANFSKVQASQAVFSTHLSLEVKRRLARRMATFPATLSTDPLLRLGVEELADPTLLGVAEYYATLPLGILHSQLLGLQDEWQTLDFLSKHENLRPNRPQRVSSIDWGALAADTRSEYAKQPENTPFGLLNEAWWEKRKGLFLKKQDTYLRPDWLLRDALPASPRWVDVELALAECLELGARPLLLAIPFNGRFADYCGSSAKVRKACYYDPLRALGRKYGVPVVASEEYEYDFLFFQDLEDHPSPVGWLCYDEAINAFYHETGR